MLDMFPSKKRLEKGPVAVLECAERIPCNPCADACPQGAIVIKEINDCPSLDEDLCNGCGTCMTHCPGLSIFVVDYTFGEDVGLVKIPYEFIPLPRTAQFVDALNRQGKCIGKAQVVRVQLSLNKTNIVWLTVPKKLIMEVRGIRLNEEENHG